MSCPEKPFIIREFPSGMYLSPARHHGFGIMESRLHFRWPEMTNVSKHGEIGIDSTTDPAEGLQNWTHEELEDGDTRQMN